MASFVIIIEPKVSDARGDKVVRRCNMDGNFHEEAIGFAGDIWLR